MLQICALTVQEGGLGWVQEEAGLQLRDAAVNGVVIVRGRGAGNIVRHDPLGRRVVGRAVSCVAEDAKAQDTSRRAVIGAQCRGGVEGGEGVPDALEVDSRAEAASPLAGAAEPAEWELTDQTWEPILQGPITM